LPADGHSTLAEAITVRRRFDAFLTLQARILITQAVRLAAKSWHERFDVCGRNSCVLHHQRALRPLLRKTLGSPMETAIVGLVAVFLFGYLFVAMIRPEKF
jgi:K+-transporting ATPase KdpF subunit